MVTDRLLGVSSPVSSAPPIPEQIIKKFARDESLDLNEANRQFEEVRKFLGVCGRDQHTGYAPSAVIDRAWHSFVLHTSQYARYCESLGGFIHHRPTDKPEVDAYVRTLAALRDTYGQVDGRYWPKGKAADCDTTCQGDGYCSDGTCEAAFELKSLAFPSF